MCCSAIPRKDCKGVLDPENTRGEQECVVGDATNMEILSEFQKPSHTIYLNWFHFV